MTATTAKNSKSNKTVCVQFASEYDRQRSYEVVICPGESIEITATGVKRELSDTAVIAHLSRIPGNGVGSPLVFNELSDWFWKLSYDEKCELGELLADEQEGVAKDWIEDHGGFREWSFLLGFTARVVDVPFTETRTFHIGDQAEHSSFNLSYYDEILSITDKTVTFRDSGASNKTKTKRLTITKFVEYNWNFSLQAAQKRNREWQD